MSLLAMLPSPIVYGAIIDNTCILWQEVYQLLTFQISFSAEKMKKFGAFCKGICSIKQKEALILYCRRKKDMFLFNLLVDHSIQSRLIIIN
jgi:Organic Anion Transporter Polypeptide (OATP) family